MSEDEFNPNSVDAKLATIIANQQAAAEDRKRVFALLEKHETEISSLKLWRSYVIGIASLGGALLKMGWDYFTTGGNHHQ